MIYKRLPAVVYCCMWWKWISMVTLENSWLCENVCVKHPERGEAPIGFVPVPAGGVRPTLSMGRWSILLSSSHNITTDQVILQHLIFAIFHDFGLWLISSSSLYNRKKTHYYESGNNLFFLSERLPRDFLATSEQYCPWENSLVGPDWISKQFSWAWLNPGIEW